VHRGLIDGCIVGFPSRQHCHYWSQKCTILEARFLCTSCIFPWWSYQAGPGPLKYLLSVLQSPSPTITFQTRFAVMQPVLPASKLIPSQWIVFHFAAREQVVTPKDPGYGMGGLGVRGGLFLQPKEKALQSCGRGALGSIMARKPSVHDAW
jgi:hypothetical protein